MKTQDRVTALAAELPGISFGYHGNWSPRLDDRTWHVYLPNPELGPGTFSDRVWLGHDAAAATFMTDTKWAEVEELVRAKYAAKPGRREAAETIMLRRRLG